MDTPVWLHVILHYSISRTPDFGWALFKMDYFNGLKKAFDSIENEMTRSLVSNNKEEPPVEPYVIAEKASSKVRHQNYHQMELVKDRSIEIVIT